MFTYFSKTIIFTLVLVFLTSCISNQPDEPVTPFARTRIPTVDSPAASATIPPTIAKSTDIPTPSLTPSATPIEYEEPVAWDIEFVQGHSIIVGKSNEVELRKAPFIIRFTLPIPLTVRLNVSDSNRNHQEVNPGLIISLDDDFVDRCLRDDGLSFPFCPATGIPEGLFNQSKNVYLSHEGYHHIYYNDENDHRWDRAQIAPEHTVFERDVAFIDEVPIGQFEGRKLYFTIFVDYRELDVVNVDELKKVIVLFE